jgi:hypothetical protein
MVTSGKSRREASMSELSKHAVPLDARAVFEGDDDAFAPVNPMVAFGGGCRAKAFSTDGTVRELAGDCADDVRGK